MAKVPHLITPQPNFFIAPTQSYTIQIPQVTTTPQCSSGITPWPPSLAPLRPAQPFPCPEVYFAAAAPSAGATLLPASAVTVKPITNKEKITTNNHPIRQTNSHSPLPSVKMEPLQRPTSKLSRTLETSSSSNCDDNDSNKTTTPYAINALIDVPGSLNRGSRTSSLSSSLSSFRFGGSLSQLWATSLSSLSNKVNNMKSTGNLHAEASMPSLGNQYFAFGGSLPELSLTSLTRLLPNSTAHTSTDNSSSTGLYTLIQSPLCVYPSQSHLATPFMNANGSITFGSFLSSGSSLCSTLPPATTTKRESTSRDNCRRNSGTPDDEETSPTRSFPSPTPPGNLSTLAYVASVQKTLETPSDQFPLMTVSTQLPPASNDRTSLSPIPQGGSGIGMSPSGMSDEKTLEMDCQVTSPQSVYNNTPPIGIKIEEDTDSPTTLGSYTEVKPMYLISSPPSSSSGTMAAGIKKESTRDKPYKCDYPGCGRSFSFPAHLRSHVQQIHISYRPCKCDFPGCGKRFYTPQHLNVHRRIHTGERPFVCPYADCGKAFTTAGNLKNHIRTHTGEKPYGCKFEGCSKRFAEMSSLKKHELTHTGEKPYKCRVCGKAFSQAGSRNTHERKHSRNDETDTKLARRYRIKHVSQDQ